MFLQFYITFQLVYASYFCAYEQMIMLRTITCPDIMFRLASLEQSEIAAECAILINTLGVNGNSSVCED